MRGRVRIAGRMMPRFDAYVTVDWSAASVPRRGADSIWYAVIVRDGSRLRQRALANPPTRAQATAELGDWLAALLADGRRVLAGFDFPFGFPAGTARRLHLGEPGWRQIWQLLADRIEDGPDNRNNRFDVAEFLNRRLTGEPFPFWGNVRDEERLHLCRRRWRAHRPEDLRERRLAELRVRRTQPVWKLAGAGSVGSQALTGLPRVLALRTDPRFAMEAAVWPFETGLAHDPDPRVIFAEIWPSIVSPAILPGLPRDAGQVVAAAHHFADLDARDGDGLPALFAGDPGLSGGDRAAVTGEEAWILGVRGTPG